jgi:hypothetical protein
MNGSESGVDRPPSFYKRSLFLEEIPRFHTPNVPLGTHTMISKICIECHDTDLGERGEDGEVVWVSFGHENDRR